MKVMVDLNVLVDVFQRREPFYSHSALVLRKIERGTWSGFIPAHAVTTVHYLISRVRTSAEANAAIDKLLMLVNVVPETKETFLHARVLGFRDFEDSVVSISASEMNCDYIVTRNTADFRDSVVPALEPSQLLEGAS
ncbi:MAG: PIN domain-containing protein [Candidatus Hydrogenedentes bacterium]|nr:PIN domain-containing protein [Candidatus Hydrogenedentota bacterium]MBI3117652.1 PIN domain-containing protein [Candidatus Hydrogenedentota bacterium]